MRRLQPGEATPNESKSGERAVVIQLLGDRDDMVSCEGQRGVTVARDFIWVRILWHAAVPEKADLHGLNFREFACCARERVKGCRGILR